MGQTALTIHSGPLPDLPVLEQRWRVLEQAARPNFFTSWTWMGSWLRATAVRPELLSVRDAGGQDIGLVVLGYSREKRLLSHMPTLRLNEAGNAAADRAFIEYNTPLCREGREGDVAQMLASAIAARRDWKALRLSGVVPGEPLIEVIPARRKRLVDSSPAYFADLAAVRNAGGDYLSLLSSNSRSQIKRSAKEYAGDTQIIRAPGDAVSGSWLEEMRALNAGRHVQNAWDEPVFRMFAQKIVQTGLQDGSVDLLRVQAGEALLGYLITFLSGGKAMNYQSAFAEPLGTKAKPGLMAHAAAIRHYAERGYDRYSLLAGRDRYKQSLSTGAETLEWWILERFSPALEAEYWLRRLLRR